MITLRVALTKGEYSTVINCYAPKLASDEETKDRFYEDLHGTLTQVKQTDKILLLDDFNARVVMSADIWGGAL